MNFYHFIMKDLEIFCGENHYFHKIFYNGEEVKILEHIWHENKFCARINNSTYIPLIIAGFIVDFVDY